MAQACVAMTDRPIVNQRVAVAAAQVVGGGADAARLPDAVGDDRDERADQHQPVERAHRKATVSDRAERRSRGQRAEDDQRRSRAR